jgi:hypothetical protein
MRDTGTRNVDRRLKRVARGRLAPSQRHMEAIWPIDSVIDF